MKPALNLPSFEPLIREKEGQKEEIFDPVRKRYVALTPEEWVRQHVIYFLTVHLEYPGSLIAVEARLRYNRMQKRTDIVVYSRSGQPSLIVECKAPGVAIGEAVLQQAAMYNMPLQVQFVVLTNGLDHHILFLDRANMKIVFRDRFPDYDEL